MLHYIYLPVNFMRQIKVCGSNSHTLLDLNIVFTSLRNEIMAGKGRDRVRIDQIEATTFSDKRKCSLNLPSSCSETIPLTTCPDSSWNHTAPGSQYLHIQQCLSCCNCMYCPSANPATLIDEK